MNQVDHAEEKSGIDMGQLKADAQKPKKTRAPRQNKGPKPGQKFGVTVDVETTIFLEFESKEKAAILTYDVDQLLASKHVVKKQSQVAEIRFT
jgi:hypothetical protein